MWDCRTNIHFVGTKQGTCGWEMIQVVSTKQLKIETCSQREAACFSLADLSQQGSSAGFSFAKCHIRVGKLMGFCFNRTRFDTGSQAKFSYVRDFYLCSSGTSPDIDIFQNVLVNIDIDIFEICRYIDYRYKYSIFHQQNRGKNTQIG